MIQLDRVFSLSLSQSGFTSAHLVCTTRATARWSKTFTRISSALQELLHAYSRLSLASRLHYKSYCTLIQDFHSHLVCTTRATARWSKTFTRISSALQELLHAYSRLSLSSRLHYKSYCTLIQDFHSHLVCTTRATARLFKTFTRISSALQELLHAYSRLSLASRLHYKSYCTLIQDFHSHLVCTTRATARWFKTFTRISSALQELLHADPRLSLASRLHYKSYCTLIQDFHSHLVCTTRATARWFKTFTLISSALQELLHANSRLSLASRLHYKSYCTLIQDFHSHLVCTTRATAR